MSPVKDAQCTAFVLFLYSIAYVDEFTVFEYQEVMLVRENCQTINGSLAEVLNDINVRFQDGNERSQR